MFTIFLEEPFFSKKLNSDKKIEPMRKLSFIILLIEPYPDSCRDLMVYYWRIIIKRYKIILFPDSL